VRLDHGFLKVTEVSDSDKKSYKMVSTLLKKRDTFAWPKN